MSLTTSVATVVHHHCLPIWRLILSHFRGLRNGLKKRGRTKRSPSFRTSGTSFLPACHVSHPCAIVTFLTFLRQREFRGASLAPGYMYILNTPEVKRIAKRALHGAERRRRRKRRRWWRKGNKNSLSAPGGCPSSVTAGYFFLWQSDKRRIFIPRVRAYLR